MKEWLIKYTYKKGSNTKYLTKCGYCGIEFMTCGAKRHCSWKCFLYLSRNIDKKGCWLWEKTKTDRGYGRTSNGKFIHRLSWEVFKGPIPKGLFVCHVCDIPNCFNPEHLFISDHTGNMRDCAKKGRRPKLRGETNPRSKLTEKQVREIREKRKEGMKTSDIAKEYKMCVKSISNIFTGKRWSHI